MAGERGLTSLRTKEKLFFTLPLRIIYDKHEDLDSSHPNVSLLGKILKLWEGWAGYLKMLFGGLSMKFMFL